MAKGVVIGILIVVVLFGIGMFFFFSSEDTSDENAQIPQENPIENPPIPEEEILVDEVVVSITPSGFSPKSVEVLQGQTIVFINQDTKVHWPASAVHPTHRVYPESDIEKCKTEEKNKIFDACRGLKQGEEFRFTFNERGTWNYHDHVVSGVFGTITVS